MQLRRIPYSLFLIFNVPEDVVERLLVRTQGIIVGTRILDILLIHEVAIAYFVIQYALLEDLNNHSSFYSQMCNLSQMYNKSSVQYG